MLTTEGNLQRFPPPAFHQPGVKRAEIMLTLVLMLAPILLSCGSGQRTTDSVNSKTISSEKITNNLTNDVGDMQLCLDTMSNVDETAHSAAGRGDFERALKIWRMSSQDGNEFSKVSLCIFHITESTPVAYRDYKEGFEICSSLALDGSVSGQYVLARMYGAGIGVEQNETKALYWFHNAAEGGNPEAQFIIGGSYLTGKGFPKDLILAYKWLNLAAGNDVEKAHEWRDLVASSLTRSELSEAQSLTRSYTPRPISGRDICSKWLAQRQEFY